VHRTGGWAGRRIPEPPRPSTGTWSDAGPTTSLACLRRSHRQFGTSCGGVQSQTEASLCIRVLARTAPDGSTARVRSAARRAACACLLAALTKGCACPQFLATAPRAPRAPRCTRRPSVWCCGLGRGGDQSAGGVGVRETASAWGLRCARCPFRGGGKLHRRSTRGEAQPWATVTLQPSSPLHRGGCGVVAAHPSRTTAPGCIPWGCVHTIPAAGQKSRVESSPPDGPLHSRTDHPEMPRPCAGAAPLTLASGSAWCVRPLFPAAGCTERAGRRTRR